MASLTTDIIPSDNTTAEDSALSTPMNLSPTANLITTTYNILTAILTASVTETSTVTSLAIATSMASVGSTSDTTFQSTQVQYENQTVGYISPERRSQVLGELQEKTTRFMIPAMTYLIILAVTGIIGNSLVLFVYSKKFRQTPTRIFIVAIASFDIVTNTVAIPGEIYDMFHTWDFDQPVICKLRLYVNAFTTMVSAMVLVAVAAVRYRKICSPFKTQVSINQAKIITIVLTVLSLIFSVPYSVINGKQTKSIQPGIDGYECTIDDSYKDTIWPIINIGFFILLFVSCSVPLVIMYICIGVTAWKHNKFNVVASYKKGKQTSHGNDSSNSAEATTKSTESTSAAFLKSARTKSYVKKSGKSVDGSSTANRQRGKNCSENHISETYGNNCNNSAHDEACEVENIENFNEANSNTKTKGSTSTRAINNNSDYPVRVIHTPTGERVQVNLKMVRELTVKLRAVKKEAERDGDGDGDDNEDDENEVNRENGGTSPEIYDFQEKVNNTETGNKLSSNYEKGASVKEKTKRSTKAKRLRNKSADPNLCSQITPTSNRSKRFSKSLDDLHRLTEESFPSKKLLKNKAAEHEDLDMRVGKKDVRQSTLHEESETSKDEPMSEFSKAMEWVDLTYCLTEDNKNNEITNNDANMEEVETNGVSKKGSFSLSRKISRDNSFLQRHRKLKDALTDTLTRARRSKREREAAEARDNHGHVTLENINSESENTCTNEDSDNVRNEEEDKGKPDEDKLLKLKDGVVKVDIVEEKSGRKFRVESNHGKQRGIGRTTRMLILISAIYILGFLPFLALMFARNASPSTFEAMELAAAALYNLFLRSYFLNSAANPVVYSLCDINFRRECLQLLKCS